MSAPHVNERVQKYRDALRLAGLRPVQLWVVDTRRPEFASECARQCLLAAEADRLDPELRELMDDSLNALDGWHA